MSVVATVGVSSAGVPGATLKRKVLTDPVTKKPLQHMSVEIQG